MILRRGQNRWLVVCASFVAAFLLFAYYDRDGASNPLLTSTARGSTATALSNAQPQHSGEADLEFIVATTKQENVTWLGDYLLDWPKNIYVVDDRKAALTVPQNKGHEAMVFLTYIIDRYDTLPANMLFHHAQRFQWHNDDPDYDALQLLKRFRVSHLREHGYVNLRCTWMLGCPVEIRPLEDARSAPENENGIPHAKHVYSQAFSELFPGVEVPAEVGVPCCSQFGVTRETVRARPREDYIRFREWLMATDLDDAISGRVFEYGWHIIFNKKAVHCPNAADCYCLQYGMCDKADCDEHGCPGQYIVPKYANLPDGWPMLGWDGEDRHWSETHNRLIAAILTHYRTLMMLATVQAEDDQENATPEAMAVAGIAMKMEFDGLYSSVKELLTLSRKIKELWVFGALGQQDPSRAARDARIEHDVAAVAELLNGLEATRMGGLAASHGGSWQPLRKDDIQALQALAGKQ
ncbi:hypothetical protein V2A60_005528 [Cordyceps javanica]